MGKFINITLLLAGLVLASNVYAFRCSIHLVQVGDKTSEVARKCGQPKFKEIVGYIITKNKKRELQIKEWVYGPKNGRYYYLTFHGTKLVDIESRAK